MPSPLTPKRGYTFTLSQVIGDRPRVAIGCTRCHYLDESRSLDVEAATDEALGRIVRAALDEWGSHMCEPAYPSTLAEDPHDAIPYPDSFERYESPRDQM